MQFLPAEKIWDHCAGFCIVEEAGGKVGTNLRDTAGWCHQSVILTYSLRHPSWQKALLKSSVRLHLFHPVCTAVVVTC